MDAPQGWDWVGIIAGLAALITAVGGALRPAFGRMKTPSDRREELKIEQQGEQIADEANREALVNLKRLLEQQDARHTEQMKDALKQIGELRQRVEQVENRNNRLVKLLYKMAAVLRAHGLEAEIPEADADLGIYLR